jgi:hypothetical protein
VEIGAETWSARARVAAPDERRKMTDRLVAESQSVASAVGRTWVGPLGRFPSSSLSSSRGFDAVARRGVLGLTAETTPGDVREDVRYFTDRIAVFPCSQSSANRRTGPSTAAVIRSLGRSGRSPAAARPRKTPIPDHVRRKLQRYSVEDPGSLVKSL